MRSRTGILRGSRNARSSEHEAKGTAIGNQGDGAPSKRLSISEARVGCAPREQDAQHGDGPVTLETIESKNRGVLEYPDITGSSTGNRMQWEIEPHRK